MATTQGMGSIIQMEKDKPRNKCRKWQLRVSLGKDTKTGKYYQKTRTVNGSYSVAKAALREFIEEIEENRVQSRTSWTFKAYSEYFLEQRELKKEVAKTTLERQRGHFKAACMHIGEAKLESITPAMLNSMYIALLSRAMELGQLFTSTFPQVEGLQSRRGMEEASRVEESWKNRAPRRTDGRTPWKT